MTLVSVLLPVHNGVRYLESSARSILNQTHQDLEVLVLDDGSTDGSGELAKALGDSRVQVMRSDHNLGLPATLNRGLAAARGDIVARQDADDVSHPCRLQKQVAFLESNPEVGLAGTQAWLMDEHGRCTGILEHACQHQSLVWELFFDNAFVHSSVAFRRDLVRECGGYDEAWPYNQDYDLWLRLAPRTRLANLPERLLALRSHSGSMTETMSDESAASNRRLLARNLEGVLRETSAEAVELVARAREGLEVADLRALIPRMEGWVSSYLPTVDPRSRDDYRIALARQYCRMAFARRGRSWSRVVLALWAGRRVGPELIRTLLQLVVFRARLRLGSDPLSAFGSAAVRAGGR